MEIESRCKTNAKTFLKGRINSELFNDEAIEIENNIFKTMKLSI